MARTNLCLHGSVVVVVGYGEVGAGLASAAKSFGARVLIAELDPARRVIAQYEGYETGPLAALAPRANVLVTATGRDNVVSARTIADLPEGCFLLNAGHSPAEIAVEALGPGALVLPHLTSHHPGGKEVLLVSHGHIVNLTAGDGDTLNSFDITAALMVTAVGWSLTHGTAHPPGIHPLPTSAWHAVVGS